MKSNTNNKAKGLKRKRTKGPDPTRAREKKSGLNPTLPFVKPSKDTDANKETVSIKMRIDDTISKDDKTNYKTKSFKEIETFWIQWRGSGQYSQQYRPIHMHDVCPERPASHREVPRTILDGAERHGKDSFLGSYPRLPSSGMQRVRCRINPIYIGSQKNILFPQGERSPQLWIRRIGRHSS